MGYFYPVDHGSVRSGGHLAGTAVGNHGDPPKLSREEQVNIVTLRKERSQIKQMERIMVLGVLTVINNKA